MTPTYYDKSLTAMRTCLEAGFKVKKIVEEHRFVCCFNIGNNSDGISNVKTIVNPQKSAVQSYLSVL